MVGDTMLWVVVGGIVLGSIGFALAAAASGPVWDRWRARRLPPADPGGRRHGEWVLGDPKLAAQLVTALCQLRRGMRARDTALPAVAAVLVGYDRLILRLTRPASVPPFPPWRLEAGDPTGVSWVVDTGDLSQGEPGPDPYPLLTVVGSADGWTVLVDLAQPAGPVTLTGDDPYTHRLLGTVAYRLATSPWSSEARIVLVGTSREVAVPHPGRVGYVASVAEAVEHAERAGEQPLALLLGQCPTGADRLALARLATDPRRAVLVACPSGAAPAGPGLTTAQPAHPHQAAPMASHPGAAPAGRTLAATPDGRLRIGYGELAVEPFPTTPARAATTAVPPAVTAESVRTLSRPLLTEQAQDRWWPAEAEVRLLGPFEVRAPGTVPGEHWPALAPVLAMSAVRPAGVPAPVAGALLPQPDAATAAARDFHDWLGADPTGLPRLREQHGAWRLAPDVRVDLHLFRALVTAADPANERPRLATALVLIRGELFAGMPVGPVTAPTFSRHAAEIRTLAIRAVRRDAELALAAGDPVRAEWALRQGLVLLPRWEILWRMLLQFQRDHHREVIPRTVDEMVAALAAGPGRTRPEPATRKLLVRLGQAGALRAMR